MDDPPRSLVWLASYPKSGNTWMRMLLAAYATPDLDRPLELPDAFRVTRNESRREDYVRLSGREDLTAADIHSLRHAVQMDLARRVRPPVLLKTHNARCVVGGVPIIHDELTLGAVYIVRNPLDVVDSVADHWGVDHAAAITMMNRASQCIGGPKETLVTQHLRSWSLHVSGWTEHAAFPVHVVRYEELLAATAPTLRNVLTFLGWPADRRRIDHAVEQTRLSQLARREADGGFAERSQKSAGGRFFRHGRSGRWREVLTGPQIATVRQHHGEVMRRFGY